MRSGPKAILYRDCLFRVSELIWVKAHPLNPLRLVTKLALIGLGVLFFFAVAWGKGTYKNLEGLLGFFALYVGMTAIVGDTRLASTGDLTESYEARGGEGEARAFRSWISALGDGDDECKLGSAGGAYNYWFNLARVAWARPTWLYDLTGLIIIPIYLGYAWVLQQDLSFLKKFPWLDEVKFLSFPNGSEHVLWLCWIIAAMCLVGVLSSLGRGLEVRACGGLSDQFRVTRAEQLLFMERLSGLTEAAPSPAVVVTSPVAVLTPVELAPTRQPVEAVVVVPEQRGVAEVVREPQ